MPKLTFEVMIVNNSTKRKTLNLTLAEIKKWFSNSPIIFINSDEEEDVRFKSKNGEISFSFELKEYNSDLPEHSSFILIFNSLTNVYKPKITLYDDFVKELKIIINKNHCKSYFLNRELSKYYSRELYTIFHDFEVGLRRFMHLIFFKTFGPKWEEEIIPKEFKNSVAYRFDNKISDHIIEEFELAAIENLLFKPIFIEKTDTENNKDISPVQNIGSYDKPEYVLPIDFILNSTSNYTVFSLWDRYFSQYVRRRYKGEQFINSFQTIREIRNKVAHNKKITHDDYIETKNFLKGFQLELTRISNSLLDTEQDQLNYFDYLDFNNQMLAAIGKSLVPNWKIKEITNAIQEMTNPYVNIGKSLANITSSYPKIWENTPRETENFDQKSNKKEETPIDDSSEPEN